MDALDKRTFEMWVREITTRLDRQDKLIAMLARKEYEKDNSDVMEIPLVDGEKGCLTIRTCVCFCNSASVPCNDTVA